MKVRAYRTLENALRRMGFVYVAGVDEVGRGCLAGPVVAAAVVLDPDCYIPRISDSKTVTALERLRLYERITRHAVCWSVIAVEPDEIDRIEVVRAAKVRRAKLYFLRDLKGKAARMKETGGKKQAS